MIGKCWLSKHNRTGRGGIPFRQGFFIFTQGWNGTDVLVAECPDDETAQAVLSALNAVADDVRGMWSEEKLAAETALACGA